MQDCISFFLVNIANYINNGIVTIKIRSRFIVFILVFKL